MHFNLFLVFEKKIKKRAISKSNNNFLEEKIKENKYASEKRSLVDVYTYMCGKRLRFALITKIVKIWWKISKQVDRERVGSKIFSFVSSTLQSLSFFLFFLSIQISLRW